VQEIRTQASVRTSWFTQRDGTPGLALQQQLMHRPQPPGPGYVWMAGESSAMRTLRLHFSGDRGLSRERLGVKGYWKNGEADHRDRS
jgi:NADPH-dependent ferric siderophore reductase